MRWPDQAGLRAESALEGRPVLLLVERSTTIPTVGPLEDWIYVDADERDVHARLIALERRAAAGPTPAHRPALRVLDGLHGPEARLARRLLDPRVTGVAVDDALLAGGIDAGRLAEVARRLAPLALRLRSDDDRWSLEEDRS